MTRNFLYCLLFVSQIGFPQDLKITEPELVFVEAGDFRVGCTDSNDTNCLSDEKPATITLYDYWIGKYEVTNAQYAEFLSEEGNQVEGNKPWYIMDKYALIKETKSGEFISKKGFENYPVNNINWYGAKAYAIWLSKKTNKLYRLPTEAEWEFAAKGGKKSKGYIYSGSNNLNEVSWNYENAINSKTEWGYKNKVGTFPVGQKKPNELGIYDMAGNLSEWTLDVYDHKYKEGINPSGPKIGGLRTIRGGSWDHGSEESRNTARTRQSPISNFTTNKGFRVVMEKNHFLKIDTVAKKYNFNGVILVKKRDDIVYHKSFGIANRKQNIPMTNETTFSMMSITKLFTSTIILQLMEEEKIDLNHTIAKYLPNYKGAAANVVTMHQLLNHTSGIQPSEKIKFKKNGIPSIYLNKYSTDQLLDNYCSGPLVYEPGTKFYYDNGDYIILGKIIESIENDTYENILKRRILNPLKMNNSGLITNSNYEKLNLKKSFPKGYSWDKKGKALNEDEQVYTQNYFSGGGMYATVTDLAKFSDALYLKKSLLSKLSMELLLQTYPEGNQYGYGVWSRFHNRGKYVIKAAHRPGRNMGINTMLTYVLDHDICIIIFSNTNKISVDGLTTFIQKQIFEK
ncbi:MAG: SUMF1/EgtB/PvdO family nonheme iron enzyme [Flavobacteriaceae bacterium]